MRLQLHLQSTKPSIPFFDFPFSYISDRCQPCPYSSLLLFTCSSRIHLLFFFSHYYYLYLSTRWIFWLSMGADSKSTQISSTLLRSDVGPNTAMNCIIKILYLISSCFNLKVNHLMLLFFMLWVGPLNSCSKFSYIFHAMFRNCFP